MPESITVTERDARELARLVRELKTEVQKSTQEQSDNATAQLIRSITESAIASDAVSTTEITSPGMIWDDANRGWDYSEWNE